ncbi:MAG: hypothetical protein H0W24_11210 [Lysobacter sp.]|nr:hypothetical protein [Lysobacter sp.]
MSPTKYHCIGFTLSALLLASPLSAQEGGKTGTVQEDPILRSIERTEAAEETLVLPSDPDQAFDREVQEDPLVSGLDEEPRKKPQARTDRKSRPQQDKQATVDSAVERDPILQTSTGHDAASDQVKDEKETPKRTEPKRRLAEPETDRDLPLVPEPKDSSVQEDPLLRSIDPPR